MTWGCGGGTGRHGDVPAGSTRCPVRRWGHAGDSGRRCGSRYSPAPLLGDDC